MDPDVKDPAAPGIHPCCCLTSVGKHGGPKRKHLPFLSPFSSRVTFSPGLCYFHVRGKPLLTPVPPFSFSHFLSLFLLLSFVINCRALTTNNYITEPVLANTCFEGNEVLGVVLQWPTMLHGHIKGVGIP